MGSNEPSKHLALTLGFTPVMKDDKQVEVEGWGKQYLVFQLNQKVSLNKGIVAPLVGANTTDWF